MWTEKYAPKQLKDIIGNEKSVSRLQQWLQNWGKQQKKGVLVSGTFGIGKSLACHLLAKENHYHVLELNASDSRSAKKLDEFRQQEKSGVSRIDHFFSQKKRQKLDNTTTTTSCDERDDIKADARLMTKTLIIMDEVDNAESNSSRSLLKILKETQVPILCICNDRYKVKSLLTYCEDISFQKPASKDVQLFAHSVMVKEGFKYIDPQALANVCSVSNNDIRHILNELQMLRLTSTSLKLTDSFENLNIVTSTFSLVPQLFSSYVKHTFSSMLESFFSDKDMIPLFIEENYLNVASGNHKMDSFARAAEHIALGDIVNTSIQSGQNWELLSFYGILSSVAPCFFLRGRAGKIEFPKWLGTNSSHQKNRRLLLELRDCMLKNVTGLSTLDILDYLPLFWEIMVVPLSETELENGDRKESVIQNIIDLMKNYSFTKDEWDSLYHLMDDKSIKIDKKVKSSFTRQCNKKLGKRSRKNTEVVVENDDDHVDEEDEEV